MTWILLKKQLREFFRGWFYDPRTGAARTKTNTILMIVVFLGVSLGIPVAMIVSLATSLCAPLAEAGALWLYFAILGLIALLLGVLVSGFGASAAVYQGKDNDLLLSLPIPLRSIITARVLTVYLMGLLYSGVVSLPAAVVYCLTVPLRLSTVLGALVWVLLLSLLALVLSCLLGYVVAQISRRLKNKSYITTIIALVFLALYYVFYIRGMDFISSIASDPAAYGAVPEGAGRILWYFGRAGEGDLAAIGLVLAVLLVLGFLMGRLLIRSFLDVISAAKVTERIKRPAAAKASKQSSPFAALLRRDLGRFTASANYMLNCGIASVLLLLAGAALLWKRALLMEALGEVFGALPGFPVVLLATGVCAMAGMNDLATPSVALEGKSLWIARSLPVDTAQVLRSKLAAQLVVTAPPALFCGVCAAICAAGNALEALGCVLLPLCYCAFTACVDLRLGLWRTDIHWTQEIAPIKQSLNVLFALVCGAPLLILFAGGYFALSEAVGAGVWLLAMAVLSAALACVFYRDLMKKGVRLFEAL